VKGSDSPKILLENLDSIPYPSHTLEKPIYRRTRTTHNIRPGMGSTGSNAPTNAADTLRQRPR
jgi:hypothetical protein